MRICCLCLLALLLAHCTSPSRLDAERAKIFPLTRSGFLELPFSFEAGLHPFQNRNGSLLSFDVLTLPREKNQALVDTFYHMYNNQADIYFLHDPANNHPLFTADIADSNIRLITQSIAPGLTREEFFWRFSDWPMEWGDTLRLTSREYEFSFLFVQNVLAQIQIQPAAE